MNSFHHLCSSDRWKGETDGLSRELQPFLLRWIRRTVAMTGDEGKVCVPKRQKIKGSPGGKLIYTIKLYHMHKKMHIHKVLGIYGTFKPTYHFSLLLCCFFKSENPLHDCPILHLNWIYYFILIDLLHNFENKVWTPWQKSVTNVIMVIVQLGTKSTLLWLISFVCLLFPSVSSMRHFTLWGTA